MSFEKWFESAKENGEYYSCLGGYNNLIAEDAYSAGVQAERERCARVAETHRDAGCVVSVSGQTIAAAIREG